MTLQELRYLVALADKGHFAHAAQACHVGQPTLSTQLRKLEEDLGVTLFERSQHQSLHATPIGDEIIERARLALDVVQQIRGLARRGRNPMDGPLRLGVIPTLGPYLIPHLLPALRRSFPQLRLYVREDVTARLLERLRQGRLDALLLATPVRGADVETMALFNETFVVALPKDHALAAKALVSPRDLAGETVLLLEEGHCMRDQVLAICGGTALDEHEELKATSVETLRQMTAAGVGCALLPRLAAVPGTGSILDGMLQIRPFAPPGPARKIGLAWRHSHPCARTVQSLGELIRANLPGALDAECDPVERTTA